MVDEGSSKNPGSNPKAAPFGTFVDFLVASPPWNNQNISA